MSTTVSYKGQNIATVSNNTKTLETEGKYLEADIILTDQSQSTPVVDPLMVTPTTSQQTFNSSLVDGYKPVVVNAMPSGTAGTPTASKGAVSNHSVSVTPSVTNATGYIIGSTKTGAAVTVTASELVSGSETKTQNGTYDVTNLAELVINVSGGGGGGLEYETGIWSPSSDVTTGEILFTNTHNQPPFFFVITDVDGDQHTNRTNTNAYAVFVNWDRILGTTIYPSSSSTRIGSLTGGRRTTQSTSLTAVTINFISDSNAATYATNTSIRPFLNSSTYWRTGYNYKWIAVWAPTT